MPITAALFKVLFENVTPQEAAEELMGRVKKHEVEASVPASSWPLITSRRQLKQLQRQQSIKIDAQ